MNNTLPHLQTLQLLTLTILIGINSLNAETTENTWKVWVDDGKTDHPITITKTPFSFENDGYFNALKNVTYWNVVLKKDSPGTEAEKSPYRPENLKITKIGKWGPYQVTDLTNQEPQHKGIVLTDEENNNYLLYIHFIKTVDGGTIVPTITTVNNHSVLAYKATYPGTGYADVAYYFMYDSDKKCPRAVDISAIEKAITKTVPKDWGVWKGGGLDFNGLRYSHYIWRPHDGNCCPTGGKIDLKLTLEDYALKVTAIDYQPDARP